VDSPEAQTFVDTLDLPLTPAVSTGKGMHYYFQLPAGGVRNKTGIAGHKLDLRGDGGYVIGAGSIHPSGRRYEWDLSPEEVPFAPFPQQVLKLIQEKRGRPRRRPASAVGNVAADSGGRFDGWLSSTQRDAVAAINKAEEGTRNDTLFGEGVQLAREVAGAGASWADYSAPLREAALANGLEEEEVERTLGSCWNTGSADPTAWMITAQEWIYLSHQEVFYHVESRQYVKVAGFNGTFGSQLAVKGSFHKFLLDGDFVIKVFDLTYRPDTEERFVQQDGLVWYNTYRPSGVIPVSGDWSPFVNYLSYLVPEPAERDHLLKMIAWTVRHPGRKLRHALLLRSAAQGIGKTMLTEIWGGLLGQHNVRKTSTEEVQSQYQGFLKENLLVVLEELNRGVGPMIYNRMKTYITDDVASVNEKFLKVRDWPNNSTFVILTNMATPIIMEKGDRRFFYIDSPATPREPGYYRSFAEWWGENLGVIRAFIDTIDLSEFDPHAPPPMTVAKEALIADGREELVRELVIAIEERTGPFNRDIVDLDEIEAVLGNSLRGKSRTQLREALKAIGALPFGQQRVPGKWQFGIFVKSAERASLWAIRHPEYWALAGAQARGEEYGREEGRFAYLHGIPIAVRHISEMPLVPQRQANDPWWARFV
jgi:hypothetical protein